MRGSHQRIDGFEQRVVILAQRVVRFGGQWVARPARSDQLSDIVLGFLAADVLGRRELYESSLCVCAVCGQLSFEPTRSGRSGCDRHPSASASTSGVRAHLEGRQQ